MSDAAIYELRRTDAEFRKARECCAMIPNCDLRRDWQLSGQQVGFREFIITMAQVSDKPS